MRVYLCEIHFVLKEIR